MTRKWAPQTRYTLWSNTASIKKRFDLNILQFIQSLQTIVPQSGCALTFEQKKGKKMTAIYRGK